MFRGPHFYLYERGVIGLDAQRSPVLSYVTEEIIRLDVQRSPVLFYIRGETIRLDNDKSLVLFCFLLWLIEVFYKLPIMQEYQYGQLCSCTAVESHWFLLVDLVTSVDSNLCFFGKTWLVVVVLSYVHSWQTLANSSPVLWERECSRGGSFLTSKLVVFSFLLPTWHGKVGRDQIGSSYTMNAFGKNCLRVHAAMQLQYHNIL